MSDDVEIVIDPEPSVAGLAVRDQAPLVRPAADLAEVEQAFRDYDDLCRRLLDPSDYQQIGRKQFRKRSGWRKLGVAFSIDYEIRDKQLTWDDQGNVVFAEFTVRAVAPNGRHVDGWGACDRKERAFAKPNHDIPATAETRAKNRAAADLFGMGEVSAEEMQGAPRAPTSGGVPAPEPPGEAPAPCITPAKVKRLWTVARGKGLTEDDVRVIVGEHAGVESTREIPADRYDQVMTAIADWVPFG